MAHNIATQVDGRAAMAFLGARKDVWHGLGQAMTGGQSTADWAKAAGLDWRAMKVPLYANVLSLGLPDPVQPISPHGAPQTLRGVKLADRFAIVRSDNAHVLGIASDIYQPHQPAQVLDWFQHYISVDPRFQLDTAGVLKNGEIIWAMASFQEDQTVAGDKHKARLLMTTTFDGSGATINKATMTRVVCNNTLDAALADGGKSIVRTRHSTKFDAAKVAKELANIAHGFEQYRVMGEAMARVHMSEAETAALFKSILGIDPAHTDADLSAKKRNALSSLSDAYLATVKEGTEPGTAWCALNAVTRYADHDKHVRGGNSSVAEARVLSSQFGSGAAMKAQAVQILYRDADSKVSVGYRAQAAAELDARRATLAGLPGDGVSLLDTILG